MLVYFLNILNKLFYSQQTILLMSQSFCTLQRDEEQALTITTTGVGTEGPRGAGPLTFCLRGPSVTVVPHF